MMVQQPFKSILQKYPWLFANEEFSVISHDEKHEGGYRFKVIGYLQMPTPIGEYRAFQVSDKAVETISVNHAKLIARPIDSMTDEECEEWYSLTPSESMAYMLSIGVYPFDQQAFKDGTVIKAEGESA